MKFIDKCILELKAGDGGDGIVAWRREAHYSDGGPWGGDGGDGGDIILEADHNEDSLFSLRYVNKIYAQNGQNGMSKLCHGANGKDKIVKVPVGCVVKEFETNTIIADLVLPGQKITICKGGKGGHGNAYFKSSYNKAPSLFEKGDIGQKKKVIIELKHLADIGLVGLPNAGKSTFVKTVTAAKPKIGDYRFTTLVPVLGTIMKNNQKYIIADIPGLIEQASAGKGLGHEFLKHIERCKVLLHIISMKQIDHDKSIENSYTIIMNELEQYNHELLNKKIFTVASKVEDEATKLNFINLKKHLLNEKVYPISAKNNDFGNLLEDVFKFLNNYQIKDEQLSNYRLVKEIKKSNVKFKIIKMEDGIWTVESPYIEYWVNKIPFTTDDNKIRLEQKIKLDEILNELRKKGALTGDVIKIYDLIYKMD